MKKFFLLILTIIGLFISTNSVNAEFITPQQKGYINDYGKVLSPSAFIKLDKIVLDLKSKTGVEIFVVTINSLEGGSLDDVATSIANSWTIDNGAIILISKNDLISNIFSTGDIKKYLYSRKMGELNGKYLVPYVQLKKYDEGSIYTTFAVANTIANSLGVKLTQNITLPNNEPTNPLTFKEKKNLLAFFFLIFLISTILSYVGRNWAMKNGLRDEYGRPMFLNKLGFKGPSNKWTAPLIMIAMLIYFFIKFYQNPQMFYWIIH